MIRNARKRKESATATTARTAGTANCAKEVASSTPTTATPPTTTATAPTSCPICYEDFCVDDDDDDDVIDDNNNTNVSNNNNNMLKTIYPCQHVCCRECLYEHCQFCIQLHKVPIGCPQHVLLDIKSVKKQHRPMGASKSTTPVNTMCSATLSHTLVHDVICLCRIDNEEGANEESNEHNRNDDEDMPTDDDEEEKKADEPTVTPKQNSPVYVVCRKNDPLWNKYVNCCEKKNQQLQHLLPSSDEPNTPPLSNTIHSSAPSNSDDSFATARADDDDDIDSNDDDENNSSSPPSNVRVDSRDPVVGKQPTTSPTVTSSTSANVQEQEMLSRKLMLALQIKPCSHCSMPLNKTGGCDHVVCPACHQDMCYNCGTHVYLQGQGYIRSCMGCQQDYIDHRQLPRNGLMFWCVYAPCCVLPILLLYPFILIIQCLCRCCSYCCCLDNSSNGSERKNRPHNENHRDDDELGATIQLGTSFSITTGQTLRHMPLDMKHSIGGSDSNV